MGGDIQLDVEEVCNGGIWHFKGISIKHIEMEGFTGNFKIWFRKIVLIVNKSVRMSK